MIGTNRTISWQVAELRLQLVRLAPVRRPPPSYRRHPSLRTRGTIIRGLPFLHFLLFGCALPPVAAFRDVSTTEAASNCLDASPSTGRDRLPERSELAGIREGAGAGVMENLWGDSKMKVLK